jgi:hypothetical protein
MLEIQGVKGETVVTYREPLTLLLCTQDPEIAVSSAFPKGKKHDKLETFLEVTLGAFEEHESITPRSLLLLFLDLPCHVFYATLGFIQKARYSMNEKRNCAGRY